MSPSKNFLLQDRAKMLAKVRAFFARRKILEVDTPILSRYAPIDAHIDIMPVTLNHKVTCYLHSSPEYGMKRLLAQNSESIYQISHVFRDNEIGDLHSPEFTMIEWYHLGINLLKMIQETSQLIYLLLGKLPCRLLAYREAFRTYTGIDYLKTSKKELRLCLQNSGLDTSNLTYAKKDELLNLIWGCLIEPNLGKDQLTIINAYPATQAALAKTCNINGEQVAQRFEIYFKGIELANGYLELSDGAELTLRLKRENLKRKALGKPTYPIDPKLIEAFHKGLPLCSGVAVGFDRLMMLRHKKKTIHEILPFPWD